MAPKAPSRDEVRQKFLDVLAGRISREEAASWADTWVIDDDPEVDDRVVWEALKDLCGVDLRVNPTDYLHNEVDIHQWLDRVENAIEEDRSDPA
jgi:hypothetical protein